MKLPNWLRPYAGRLIAAGVKAGATYAFLEWGLEVDEAAQTGFISVGVFILDTIYATTHKLVNRSVNPDDAADPNAAEVGVHKAKLLRSARNRERGGSVAINSSEANQHRFDG